MLDVESQHKILERRDDTLPLTSSSTSAYYEDWRSQRIHTATPSRQLKPIRMSKVQEFYEYPKHEQNNGRNLAGQRVPIVKVFWIIK